MTYALRYLQLQHPRTLLNKYINIIQPYKAFSIVMHQNVHVLLLCDPMPLGLMIVYGLPNKKNVVVKDNGEKVVLRYIGKSIGSNALYI